MKMSDSDLQEMSDSELRDWNEKQLFIRDGLPGEWLELADELVKAAEFLWTMNDDAFRLEFAGDLGEGDDLILSDERRIAAVSRPYILLAGFAVENLLKGLLVAQHPNILAEGVIPSGIKSHNILDLAVNVAGLDLSGDEERICRVFQEAIPYWGRYPLPLRWTNLKPEIAMDEDFRQLFLALKYRLGKMLYDLICDGWDSGLGPSHEKVWIAEYETDPEE